RNIHSQLFSRRSVEEVQAIISLLVKHGYLRPVVEEARKGPGRKPSPRFQVHPCVFKGGVCTQNQQNQQNSKKRGFSPTSAEKPNQQNWDPNQQNCREPGEEG